MPPTTRRLHKCAILPSQLLAIGILLAPGIARADELCGRQFDSLSQLYASLRNEAEASRGWQILERSTHITFVGDQKVWTFARDSQPAFPAAACLQIVPAEDAIQAIVQTRCEGAKDACDAVVTRAKSKDWSNLFD
jgi:hypothetical protein